MSSFVEAKREAYSYLLELQNHIEDSLPPTQVVVAEVENEAFQVYGAIRSLEGAFISRFISRGIHDFLVSRTGLSHEVATSSLISENRIDKTRGYANPKIVTAYPFAHPFGKSLGASKREVANKWYGPDNPLSTKHPDLCLKEPHRVLFEIKYFRSKKGNMRDQLVDLIYESLFYRGLAAVDDGNRQWHYDYAVALAYDGTEDGAFLRAWNELPAPVRNAIWSAANIFVMPLRGKNPPASS